MTSPPTENDAYVRCRLDTVVSSASIEDVGKATEELFRYLCENQWPAMGRARSKVQCAIAIDEANECITEIVSAYLPAESWQHTTVATYGRFADVIRMVRDTLPTLLVIHTNLLLQGVGKAIAACVAASPGTRYLLMAAWNQESIDWVPKGYAPLHISIGVLNMPFDREQLIAALGSAGDDALANAGDSD